MPIVRILSTIGASLFFICLLFTPLIALISVGEGSSGLFNHLFRSLIGVPVFAIYLAGVPEPTAKIIGPALLALFAACAVFNVVDGRRRRKSD